MQGLILAAGRGSRMGEQTRSLPKCLTPLCGKSLLEWQLAALKAGGVEPVAVVTGYESSVLEPYFTTTFHNSEWSHTNMVASLMCASPWLKKGPCLVSYSDIVYRSNHVRALTESPGELAITYDRRWLDLWSLRLEEPLSDAETFRLDEQGRLLSFGEKAHGLEQIQGQYMGLLKITPTGLEWMEEWLRPRPDLLARLDLTGFLRKLLEAGYPIEVVPVEAGWCEVDSLSDRDRYEAALAGPGGFSHDWRE